MAAALALSSGEPHTSRQPFSSLEFFRARKGQHVPVLLLGVLAPALCSAVRMTDACGTATHQNRPWCVHDIEASRARPVQGDWLTSLFNPHLRRGYSRRSTFSFAQGYGSLPQWQRQDSLTCYPGEMSEVEGVFQGQMCGRPREDRRVYSSSPCVGWNICTDSAALQEWAKALCREGILLFRGLVRKEAASVGFTWHCLSARPYCLPCLPLQLLHRAGAGDGLCSAHLTGQETSSMVKSVGWKQQIPKKLALRPSSVPLPQRAGATHVGPGGRGTLQTHALGWSSITPTRKLSFRNCPPSCLLRLWNVV